MKHLACSFLAWNTTKRQCKKGIASWQLSSTVTSSCSVVNSTEDLTAALPQRDRSERSQLLHNPSPAMMFRAPPKVLHTVSWAEGKQLAVSSACKALTTTAQALKELKFLQGKKRQIYFLQWKLRGKKRMVLFSPLLPYLGRKKSHAFSGILMVPTESDSAATHLSSPQ